MINILKRIKWLNIAILIICVVSAIFGIICIKECMNLITYGNPMGTNAPLYGFMLSFIAFSASVDYVIKEYNKD